ncbi:DUF4440 domain-containing protein [Mucilaginibacter terrae]|uniref:DUF4440 domain-containing protein n=1 Tax=Mucilaginibacter terrae TaxID=1955052 RepID=A0ABU3GU33_9SPHI|nr:hypothetical protein [Mucilaginibacter terrae]MDT3403292.1 hypothetical protein [Mucilaginibacter terrae]
MKTIKALLTVAAFGISTSIFAQSATVQTVVKAEEDFNKLISKKGIKDAFLTVADPEGIVFKPDAVKIAEFYGKIDKQPGTLTSTPKFARISANGDFGFTAGPYVYQNGKADDDKVYGDYVSIWKLDVATNKLKLFTNLGIQHPQNDKVELTDIKDPAATTKVAPSTDPFNPKKIIIDNDRQFNQGLRISTLGAYKEFFMAEGHYYFPGFNPMVGTDKTLQFLANQAITISAETTDANRATSNDLAYSYGRARIQKGNIVSNYNYVRIWQQDEKHRWNVLLEIFSAIEND